MISNGIDIIKIKRFDKLKNNNTFLKSIFNNNEIKYIKQSNNNSSTIAGLYAAKEAFLKSLKMGINNYSMLDIKLIHDNNRAPYIKLHGQLKKTYSNIENMSLSISHDGDYAIAMVTILIK